MRGPPSFWRFTRWSCAHVSASLLVLKNRRPPLPSILAFAMNIGLLCFITLRNFGQMLLLVRRKVGTNGTTSNFTLVALSLLKAPRFSPIVCAG
jgi:hypothetical protein